MGDPRSEDLPTLVARLERVAGELRSDDLTPEARRELADEASIIADRISALLPAALDPEAGEGVGESGGPSAADVESRSTTDR